MMVAASAKQDDCMLRYAGRVRRKICTNPHASFRLKAPVCIPALLTLEIDLSEANAEDRRTSNFMHPK